MILKITEHTKFKMYEEGITEDMIKEAIKKGSKFKQTNGFLAVYKYYSIAYKIIGKDAYKIKTVYINR